MRAIVLAVAFFLLASPSSALIWSLQRGSQRCEPPEVFYSAAHDPSVPTPCCPRPAYLCPGGVACLGTTCAPPYDSVPCTPGSALDLPNIVLYVADDQGYCHFGFMGPECRSSGTGTFLPVPVTPELDRLARQPQNEGKGRVFKTAHASAPFSFPARDTILTGLLRKDSVDPNVRRRFIPQLLAEPGGIPYCSFAGGGKLGRTSERDIGYHAYQKGRGLGKNPCVAAPCAPDCDDPPLCGVDNPNPRRPSRSLSDTFAFMDSMLIGPRVNGEVDPGNVYAQAQPFFMWYGSTLPHANHNPPAVIEDKRHRPDPTDYLFGPSFANPGQPRFPFAEVRYSSAFDRRKERQFAGLYGMIWWGDNGIHQLRQHLEGIRVRDSAGHESSLWDRTVFIFIADNGSDLPRAKHAFSENGYRTPIVVYDARLPASSADPMVEEELAHAMDIMPTVLDYAGRVVPADLPGYSLKPYVDGTQPAEPFRDTTCGHQSRGSVGIGAGRYIRTRPGTVGRCQPPGGSACSSDVECAPGVCLLGTCGSGTLCLEDDDCPAGEVCGLREQKWCRYGHHPVAEADIPPPDQQPTTPCTSDADCAALCPSADPIYCTCEYRELKLYVLADGRPLLMDLFVDPDEPGLSKGLRRRGPQPGDVPIGAGDPEHHLAERLTCCLDRWWVPPPGRSRRARVVGDPSCTGCEPRYLCHRCGDGIVNADEECDGENLGGQTCATVPGGFTGGTLACTTACKLDTSGCS